MRIPSGTIDQSIYFVAVDATDGVTRETGYGGSGFTVYRSRNGAAAAAYTTPTISELSSANMPGVYRLLLDEDMTLASGNDSEEICLHITHAGMLGVTRVIELYRPSVTLGQTLTVSGGIGQASVQSIVANAVNASALATDAVTEIVSAVWSAATRLLTAGTNIVLAKGTGITGFNDLSAAQVNAEVDTALADYDAPTKAELDAAVAPLATQSTLVSGVNSILSAVDDVPNNAEFAAAMAAIDADFTDLIPYFDAVYAYLDAAPAANAAAIHNFVVEGSFTFKDITRLSAAALLGEVSDAQTAAPIRFKGLDGISTRITMTGDQYGNRSAPTYYAGDAP